MSDDIKVKVCKKCSGFDVTELKGKVKSKHVKIGCIDQCKKHKGKVFGCLNGELVVCDTKEEFFAKIAELG